MFKKKEKRVIDNPKPSEILHSLAGKDEDGSTQIAEIIADFHENGILLAMVLFAFPIAVPLPYPPGFTTIMGIPLLTLSVQMIFASKHVKLPKKISKYSISNKKLIKIVKKIAPLMEKIESYTRERIPITHSVYTEQIVGVISLIASIAIAAPFPFTNAIPAFGIVIMCTGLLTHDGLILLIGTLIAIIGTFIAFFIVLKAFIAMKYLFVSII